MSDVQIQHYIAAEIKSGRDCVSIHTVPWILKYHILNVTTPKTSW